MEAKNKRQRALESARKGLVLNAARQVLRRKGVVQASLREIAREAGYTPGALYSFYPSKQALLQALLHEVLDQLSAVVRAARAGKPGAEEQLLARLNAWLQYLQEHPQDKGLLLHFTRFPQKRPLTDPGQPAVLQGLRESLESVVDSLQAAGLDAGQAQRGRDALLAQALGWLVLQEEQDAPTQAAARGDGLQQLRLLAHALLPEQALRTEASATREPVPANPAQVDLFG